MAAGRPQPAQQRLVVLPATLDETPGRVHADATPPAPALPAAHDRTLYATLSALRAFLARLPRPTTTTQPAPAGRTQRDPWRLASTSGCRYEALIRQVFGAAGAWAVSVAWRESRCEPGAVSPTGCVSLFQVCLPLHDRFYRAVGCDPVSQWADPVCAVGAAHALWLEQGARPWS